MAWEPDYVTVDEYKEWARQNQPDDTVDDPAIQRAITSASRAVDRFCSQHVRRQFGLATGVESRYYKARWDQDQIRWVVEIDDIDQAQAAATRVYVDVTNSDTYTAEITNFVLRPKAAPQNNRPYTQISVLPQEPNQPTFWVDGMRVDSQFGWSTFPVTVVQATLLQTNRIHKRRTAPFGVAGSPERGTQVTTNLIEELDPDIETMLQPYVKLGWTV